MVFLWFYGAFLVVPSLFRLLFKSDVAPERIHSGGHRSQAAADAALASALQAEWGCSPSGACWCQWSVGVSGRILVVLFFFCAVFKGLQQVAIFIPDDGRSEFLFAYRT